VEKEAVIARLTLYAIAAGALMALAAAAGDRLASWLRIPRRGIWLGAMLLVIALTIAMPWRAATDESANRATAMTVAMFSTRSDAGIAGWPRAVSALVDRAGASIDRAETATRWLWALASLMSLIVYAGGYAAIARRRREWRTATVNDVPVLIAPDTGPAVVGVWSTDIVVPEWVLSFAPERLDLLLQHERAHAAARDSVLVHLSRLVLVLFPWHPMLWWMDSRLRTAIEIDCDARVLNAGADGDAGMRDRTKAYGDLLLAVATHPRHRTSRLAPALLERQSSLARRIAAMHPITLRALGIRVVIVTMAAGALVVAALALPAPTLHAQRNPQNGAYDPKTPGLTLPTVLRAAKTRYTTEAMRQKIQGQVLVTAVVDEQGRVSDATIAKSLDKTYGLDEDALVAARLWHFRPGILKGTPVPVAVQLEFDYRLRRD
jgi:TonB family protein